MPVHANLVTAFLRDLSDKEFQEQAWTGKLDGVTASFDECVNGLFDDSGLGDALDTGSVYSDDVDDDLRRLGDLVDRIDARRSAEAILDDPDLALVRDLARDILARIGTA